MTFDTSPNPERAALEWLRSQDNEQARTLRRMIADLRFELFYAHVGARPIEADAVR